MTGGTSRVEPAALIVSRIVADSHRSLRYKTPVPNPDQLSAFTAWCAAHITGDEKGQAQIFLDRLFQVIGQLKIAAPRAFV